MRLQERLKSPQRAVSRVLLILLTAGGLLLSIYIAREEARQHRALERLRIGEIVDSHFGAVSEHILERANLAKTVARLFTPPTLDTPKPFGTFGMRALGLATDRLYPVVEQWTADRWTVLIAGQTVQELANPYGWIPYVIAANNPRPFCFWGESDLTDLVGVCQELNQRMTVLSRILELSGAPIAVLENVHGSEGIAVGPGAKWELPEGAGVGTGSPRRKAQVLHRRPDLRILPLRGNVETRLRKARDLGLQGAILAHAGLLRLGREGLVRHLLTRKAIQADLPHLAQQLVEAAFAVGRQPQRQRVGKEAHDRFPLRQWAAGRGGADHAVALAAPAAQHGR